MQNIKNESIVDNSSVIFRLNVNENKTDLNSLYTFNNQSNLIQKYYSIGIRNSFGLAIDPLTGNLWDTENGPDL